MVDSVTSMVQVDGATLGQLVGEFSNYDAMIAALRARASQIGLSYESIDTLASLGESATAKYLSDLRPKTFGLQTFLAITETLAIKAVFVEEEKLLAQMRSHWRRRDEKKARRSSHHAKRLGPITVARVLPTIAAEMGRRGGARRRELAPEVRSKLAQAAAKARWRNKGSGLD
jgi:hypothetical protein